MKRWFSYPLMVVVLGSCIQGEPLNSEADIVKCRFLNDSGKEEDNIINVFVGNTSILAYGTWKVNLTKLVLEVELTKGATISPNPSEYRDYSQPQEFTVTSEDRNWSKTYSVNIDTSELCLKYNFHYELSDKGGYHVIYEKESADNVDSRKRYVWASGNSGYKMTGIAESPLDYPTAVAETGVVKLETKSTGGFGSLVKMPIAAGNLFLGSFEVKDAVSNPLKATRFGLPFGKYPMLFMGYYKYKPGTGDFKAKDERGEAVTVPDQTDEGDIYAVLYKSDGLENGVLDGNNVLTSGNIIAMARVEVKPTDDEFVRFEIPFLYGDKFKPVSWPDFILRDNSEDNRRDAYLPFKVGEMNDNMYNLAVVFTSSKYGAYFAGTVGSTLYVKGVEVACK